MASVNIIVCRSVTYISWSSDFAYYFEDYLRDECHVWDNGLMTQRLTLYSI